MISTNHSGILYKNATHLQIRNQEEQILKYLYSLFSAHSFSRGVVSRLLNLLRFTNLSFKSFNLKYKSILNMRVLRGCCLVLKCTIYEYTLHVKKIQTMLKHIKSKKYIGIWSKKGYFLSYNLTPQPLFFFQK